MDLVTYYLSNKLCVNEILNDFFLFWFILTTEPASLFDTEVYCHLCYVSHSASKNQKDTPTVNKYSLHCSTLLMHYSYAQVD